MWKQNFKFIESRACFIKGFQRRFYQGSTDHRGVPGAPGRVVTLLPSPTTADCVSGLAFKIADCDVDEVLQILDFREKGGYDRFMVEAFHLQPPHEALPEKCLCYLATEGNEEYLGPDTDEAMARQIATAVGPSGPNREYLLNLADGLRRLGEHDDHVFLLETLVKKLEVQTEQFA